MLEEGCRIETIISISAQKSTSIFPLSFLSFLPSISEMSLQAIFADFGVKITRDNKYILQWGYCRLPLGAYCRTLQLLQYFIRASVVGAYIGCCTLVHAFQAYGKNSGSEGLYDHYRLLSLYAADNADTTVTLRCWITWYFTDLRLSSDECVLFPYIWDQQCLHVVYQSQLNVFLSNGVPICQCTLYSVHAPYIPSCEIGRYLPAFSRGADQLH